MRTTGLGLSAFLVASGAILAWAVTFETEGIDLQQVGLILFIVGLALGAITLVMALTARNKQVRHEVHSRTRVIPAEEPQSGRSGHGAR